jgi:hypothetical protein
VSAIVNVGVGGELSLSHLVALRAGVFTDRAPYAAVGTTVENAYFQRVDRYGGTLGLGLKFGSFDTTLGSVVTYGDGKIGAPDPIYQFNGGTPVVPVAFNEWSAMFLLSGAVTEEKAKTTIKKALGIEYLPDLNTGGASKLPEYVPPPWGPVDLKDPAYSRGAPPSGPRDELLRSLSGAYQTYEVVRRGIRPMASDETDPTCKGVSAFLADDVHRILDITRREFTNAAREVPLRDWVQVHLPAEPSSQSSPCFAGQRVIAGPEALETLAALDEVASALEKLATQQVSAQVSLSISSIPERATFVLKTLDGTIIQTRATNERIDHLYRGLYSYSLTKPQHKPTEGQLDLMSKDTPTMRCQLRPEQAAENSACTN